MEWYEVIGTSGVTLIISEAFKFFLSWRKSNAEADVTQAQADKEKAAATAAKEETTADAYRRIFDEVQENLIQPLEYRLREEINERRQLESLVRKVRDECEEDKAAILATLEAEREQRAKDAQAAQVKLDEMHEEHAVEILQANAQIQEFREVVNTLQIERGELYRGVKVLTGQLCNAGIAPDWAPPDPGYYESLTPPIPTKRREPVL